MTPNEYAFAGAAFLDSDVQRLLGVAGAPEYLKEILLRPGQDLEAEYVRLFLSPAGAVVSPWQSAHEGERRLMGDAHASALQWYSEYGLSPAAASDPADHVGLLLTFYAQMLASGADPSECARFADRHLAWISSLCGIMAEESRHEFYRELGVWVRKELS